jgi:glycosyltransferase involved in cell wall biosynthesis
VTAVTAPRIGYVLGTAAGGTWRHVGMLARGSAAAGYSVRVFGPAGTASLLGLAEAGPRGSVADGQVVFETVSIGDHVRPAGDTAAIRRLRRRLIGMTADVVHAHGIRAGALAALALRPYPGARWPGGRLPKLVVTVHNAPPLAASAARIYGLLERLVAWRADVVLCVSSDLAARMRPLRAREVGRAVVAARAAATADVRPADLRATDLRATDLRADGRPVVLGVGRLAAQKGFETLVAAAARWRDRRPEPLLAIAGTGPLAGDLARQARDLGVAVRFLGWQDDLTGLLAAADVFALPSGWEGQPMILQEALCAGCPIVAADVGGVRELTGDSGALLVSPGDPAAFAAAVLSVLDDADLAAKLSRAAARRAAALPTESAAIAAALELYRRLRP